MGNKQVQKSLEGSEILEAYGSLNNYFDWKFYYYSYIYLMGVGVGRGGGQGNEYIYIYMLYVLYIFPSLPINGLNTVGLEKDLGSSLPPEKQNRMKMNIYVFL